MSSASPKLRVLVVDDDDDARSTVKRALSTGGIEAEVNEAVDFESARQAMLSGYLDCILLDPALLGTDGLEALRAAREAHVDSPVVMLTSQADEETAIDLLRNGADDYLPKNQLSPERLAQSVRRVLRVRDAERRERDAHTALQRQAAQLRALAEVSLRIHAVFSVEDGLDLMAREARSLLGARMAITILEGDASAAPIVRVALADPETRVAAKAVAAAASQALSLGWGDSLHLTEARIQEDPDWRELSSLASGPGEKVRGLLAARLTNREGRSAGCVLLLDLETGDFAAGDEAILVQLARTAAVALENALLYRAAQEATRARDEVLAVVSHDLRNPLNTVSMSAALLRDHLTTDAADPKLFLSLVERIERGSGRMQALIEDLLEATRIDTGKLSITPTRERGSSLVREAIESVSALAEARKIRLEITSVDPDVFVRADRKRIVQLFSNLLGNSLKFTSSGRSIRLGLSRDGDEACFAVTDEGAGIEPEHLAHLFERYWRGNAPSRDGAGLGLFIARGIVEVHGGRMAVESEVGRGTVVRFWLPVADVVAAKASSA